jgi:hypothetical protein
MALTCASIEQIANLFIFAARQLGPFRGIVPIPRAGGERLFEATVGDRACSERRGCDRDRWLRGGGALQISKLAEGLHPASSVKTCADGTLRLCVV